jgi:hypothetical protein
LVALASTAALIVSLKVFVLRKASRPRVLDKRRNALPHPEPVDTAKPTAAANSPALLAAGLGIACFICCLPFLIPAFVAILGFIGSLVLVVNVYLAPWGDAVALGGVLLGGVAVVLLAHDVLTACRINPQPQ